MTYPYFHDDAAKTLEQAFEEVDDIVAFLKANNPTSSPTSGGKKALIVRV